MSNKKVVVLYKSKYGSSKRYAEWIAQETDADLYDASDITIDELMKYDIIVYGGSLYAVGMLGFSLIRNNFAKLHDKQIIVFSTGASPATTEALNEVKKTNFTSEMEQKISYFHLRGAVDFSKMNLWDKILMKLLKIKISRKKPENRNSDEKGILAAIDHPVNFIKNENLQPILDLLNSWQG